MRHLVSMLAALALLVMSVGIVGAQFDPADARDDCDYFDATQHNLCAPFMSYWHNNGGLEVFGYPISEPFQEVNRDLGVELLTQYFERERLEHHTELAGTEYEILLGRLGVEVLEAMGVNWFEFPKDSESEPNYFAETGFAIPQEFADYWSSHGLDLGDPGISYRESLALFGYPISPLQTETNMAGDTVPTQWFERARFELHDDGMVLLGLLGNELVAPGEEPETPVDVVAEGLNNPRHVSTDSDGAIYVAEAGVGGDECLAPDPEAPDFELCFGNSGSILQIVDGDPQELVTGLPSYSIAEGEAIGVHDVALGTDGSMYAVFGLDATAEDRDELAPMVPVGDAASAFGNLVEIHDDGSWTSIADLAAYEAENNTDEFIDELFGGVPDINSNPYALMVVDDGWLVVDAGANVLLHVDTEGTITPVAVFPPQLVSIPEGIELPPDVPADAEVPMQSVPTSIALGPDGAYYVGELTGFPFEVDAARIWRVVPGEEPTIFAEGFTNIAAIDFDADGNLYVLEMVEEGLRAIEMAFASGGEMTDYPGAIVRVDPQANRSTVDTPGLVFPTGMAVGTDGALYTTNWGIMPGQGEVVRIPVE